MIAITSYQFTIFTSVIVVVIWLVRLEAKVNKEIALREQFEKNLIDKDSNHHGRINGLEGRILDELRKLDLAVKRVEDKLDNKQDKIKE